MRSGVMRPGVMRKIGIAVLTLAMIVSMAAAFAACGVSSDKSDSEAGARIDYIQKAETENGVVYWEAAIKEEIDWEALGTDAQAATAIETIAQCVGSADTPSADLCQVEGFQGADGLPAFLWAVDQNDRITLYKNDGSKAGEYTLTQKDLDRILSSKGFQLKEDEWD